MPIILTPISSSDPLITSDRAILNAQLAAVNTASSDSLTALRNAASAAIKRYCNRDFWATDYTEFYDGGYAPYDVLRLRQYPVLSISRLATDPKACLFVGNTRTQRATVQTTATSLTLTRIVSGVTTQNTISYSSNVTVDQVVSSIAAVGNGWTASSQNGLGSFPSADITPSQGAVSCSVVGAYLEMHTESPMAWGGVCSQDEFPEALAGSSSAWRLDSEIGVVYGRFPRGQQNIRVDYRAGYDEIPDDVQEACVQLCCDLYNVGRTNNAVSSERIGPYSYTLAVQGGVGMSDKVKSLLSTYRVVSNNIRR